MKTLKNHFAFLFGGLLLAAFLFAGCGNPVQGPAENPDSPLAAGTGRVPLRLAGGAALTLAPVITVDSYTISFSGDSDQDDITGWNGTGTKTLTLPVGTWTITVTGLLPDGTTVIMQGSESNVVINDGATTDAVTITLSPTFGSGDGTFTYATGSGGIDFDGVSNIDTATLKITPLAEGDDTVKNLLLPAEASGSIMLVAGEYDMTVTLIKTDGSVAIRSELVHIYSGLTTTVSGLAYTFKNDDFAMTEMVSWSDLNATDVSGSTSTLTLIFSDTITDLSASDITITNAGGTGAAVTGTLNSSAASTYTLALSGISKGGEIELTVAKNGYEINPASKTVDLLRAADAPVISGQPAEINCFADDAVSPLTVMASANDGGALSYQWYSNGTNSNEDGTLIPSATSAAYSPPVSTEGTIYYYCVVTNTLADHYTSGGQTAAAPSNAAGVTVTAKTWGISLDQSETHTFTAADWGYAEAALTPKTVTINNIGNQATGDLTIALSGDNSGSFTLSSTSVSSIAVDGNISFTVVPKAGLAAATYTATVTVSGGSGITAKTFDVSFTVNSLPGSAGITIDAFVSEDGNLITSGGSTTIFRTAGDTLTVTVAAGLTGIQWSLNGADIAGGQSITFKAVDYPEGTYNLGLRVFKGGIPYSTDLNFTVTN